MQNEQLNAAYVIFEELWASNPAFDVAMAMADIELAWGKYVAAAQHYAYAKNNLPITGVTYAEAIDKGLASARQHVAELRFELSPKHASIAINGVRVKEPIFVEPGQLMIDVTADGYAADQLSLITGAGDIKDLKFKLIPNPESEVATPQEPQRKTWVLWAGGGVTAALATGGILSAMSASSDRDALKKLTLGPTQCTELPSDPACRSADDLRASRKTKLAAAQWLGIGSGAAAIGTGLLWYFWTEDADGPAITLEPSALPDQFQITWTGTL
jgi:hypothetical protein